MKILVIGELCVDEFIYGSVLRMCPEAPVPVFTPVKTVKNSGMAGNVVANIKSIEPNAEVVFWFQQEDIKKTRIVDEKSNQMIVRIDDGELQPVQDMGVISPERKKTIKESDLVIVSDYNKGYLKNHHLIEIASHGKLTILDSKRELGKTIASLFTFVKLNESESKLNEDIQGASNIIVTLGSRGAKVGDKLYEQKNPKETIDVSGAGDTFVAAFGVMYTKTQDIAKSIDYANELAGIVVGKRGVTVPF
jgi:D-beta-D-heptose 7-phosphate kinase/D-beta-D-heptose 1-phosphate adenosyltransferase